jgi:hypothetical protein
MAGLVPAIHVGVRTAGLENSARSCARDPSSSEANELCHDVDARNKFGHDEDASIKHPYHSANA